MKNKFTYLLLLLPLAIATGCLKKPKVIDPGQPLGTYTGTFSDVRTNRPKPDTLKGNLQLLLSSSTGFTVSGDTSLHAGSMGGFSYTRDTMIFNDITTSPGKVHLTGTYIFGWDGTTLLLLKGTDTAQ